MGCPTPNEGDGVMLDTVWRKLMEIRSSLAEATADDRKARAWAFQEMMALIRELAPCRQSRRRSFEAS